jgi:SnoaL-like domain
MTNPHAVSQYSAAEEAVGNVVKGYCEAWNTHDMKALAELFVDDAHWINIVGMHWPGKPAVVAGHAAYHQTFIRTTGIEMADVEIRESRPTSPPPSSCSRSILSRRRMELLAKQRGSSVAYPDKALGTLAHRSRTQHCDRSWRTTIRSGRNGVARLRVVLSHSPRLLYDR